METTKAVQPWPGKAADAAIATAVQRNRALFERFPEFDIQDLYQEAIMACRRAWPKYDPSVAAWSTFLSMVTRRRLIDLCRQRSRRAERENAVAAREWREGEGPAALAAVAEWAEAGDEAGLPGGAGGDDETLADWLGGIYRQAVHRFPPRRQGRGGRNWFTPAQVVAVVLLMRKRQLSTRGVKFLLEQDEDLRRAIQLRHVPHHMWFSRARSYATDNLGLPNAARKQDQ